MTLSQIKDLLKCRVLCGTKRLQIDVKSAKASDLMSDVLRYSGPGKLLLTGLTNIQVIRTCDIADIWAVVFVRGKIPSTETVKLSKKCDIAILTSDLSMFEACGILYTNGIKGVTIQSKKQ